MKPRYLILILFLFSNVANLLFNNGRLLAQDNNNSINNVSINKPLIEMNSFVLFVEKTKVSKDFYQSVFDLNVKLDLSNYIQFEGGITLWEMKNAISSIYKNTKNEKDSSLVKKFELYFETDDIDSVNKKLESLHVKMIHKIETQPWTQRVVRFYDPDDNIIEIGENMEFVVKRLKKQNYSDEEISNKTYFPIETIKKMLEQ